MSSSEVDEILARFSSYYKALNEENRSRYIQRLNKLLERLIFSPSGMEDVTNEMKVVIGGASIQLTFGLDRFVPEHYNQIIVLPRAYRIINYHRRLFGHIDPKQKLIFLSWRAVKYGFVVENDALNVALHEFAHCLEMESNLKEFADSFFCGNLYSCWQGAAHEKLITIRTRQNVFIKDYGGRNLRELFAVCIEAFFERSAEFKRALPELYQALSELLNQDPTNGSDPVLRSNGN